MKSHNYKGLVLVFVVMLFFLTVASATISTLNFFPTSTSLLITQSVTQKFNISVDDPLNATYAWMQNGVLVQNGSNPVYLFQSNTLGDVNITVNATRNGTTGVGVNITSQKWNASVIAASSSTVVGLVADDIVLMGSADQGASNRESTDTDAHNIFVSRSFTVKNTANETLSGLNATFTVASGFAVNDVNATIEFPQSTVAAGDSVSVSLKARVPDQLDAINETSFLEISPQVGDITFFGAFANGTQVSTTTSLNIRRKNQLIIKDIDVCVETDCEDVGNDGKVENVNPGDTIEIEVQVENLFSERESEDLEIQDIEIEYDIDEDEFSEDDNEDIGDLGPRDEETHVFSFDVEEDISSSIYDVILTVIGTDERGATHGVTREFSLDIDRKSHDIQIRRMTTTPETLDCNRQSATITVDMRNIGETDEDEGILTIKSTDLGIDEKFGPFTIEENEGRTESVFYEIKSFVQPGDYPIIAKAFFDVDKQTDEEGITLKVRDCSDEEKEDVVDEKEEDTENKTVEGTTQERVTTTPTRSTRSGSERTFGTPTTSAETKTSSFNMDLKNILPIAVAVLVVLVLLVGLLVVLRR